MEFPLLDCALRNPLPTNRFRLRPVPLDMVALGQRIPLAVARRREPSRRVVPTHRIDLLIRVALNIPLVVNRQLIGTVRLVEVVIIRSRIARRILGNIVVLRNNRLGRKSRVRTWEIVRFLNRTHMVRNIG